MQVFFSKLCMYIHIYLPYTTIDFSFQSFGQFLLFCDLTEADIQHQALWKMQDSIQSHLPLYMMQNVGSMII